MKFRFIRHIPSVGVTLVFGVAFGLACSDGSHSSGPVTQPEPAGTTLPQLERIQLVTPVDLTPERPTQPIAVSTTGQILYRPTARRSDTLLVLLDSTGRFIGRIGAQGQGPGELLQATELRFVDTVATVLDLDQAHVTRFSPGGMAVDDYRVGARQWLLASWRDSMDWMRRTSGDRPEIFRTDAEGNGGRPLVTDSDSLLRVATSGNRSASLDIPAYATDGARLALGDPVSYVIQIYDAGGRPTTAIRRNIEPRRRTARELERDAGRLKAMMHGGFRGPNGPVAIGGLEGRLDSLAKAVLPHFSRHGLWFDAEHRLWVVGETHDSTFADVFSDSTFLGRLMVPCRQSGMSVSLNGRWLGLVCASDANGDYDAELQLYRIREPEAERP